MSVLNKETIIINVCRCYTTITLQSASWNPEKKIKSETTLSHVIGFANRTVLPLTTHDDSSIVNSSRITKYRRGNLAPFTDGSCPSCVGDFIAIAVRELDK